MIGCRCGCGGWPSGLANWPLREERIAWLEGYERNLHQQAAEVAEELRRLKLGQQPGT